MRANSLTAQSRSNYEDTTVFLEANLDTLVDLVVDLHRLLFIRNVCFSPDFH